MMGPKGWPEKRRGDPWREKRCLALLVPDWSGAATLSSGAAPNPQGWLSTSTTHTGISHRAVLCLVAMSVLSRGPAAIQEKSSNFSIEHILNVAGGKQNVHFQDESKHFEWLNCTRYRPPKLPRQRKKEGVQRRSLGRSPRIPFSSSQVAFLEAKFLRTPYLSSNDVTQLANYLKLSETKVKIWFQNRRAREKREKEAKSQPTQTSPKNYPSTLPSTLLPQPPSPSPPPLTLSPPPPPYLQLLPPLDLTQPRFVPTPDRPLHPTQQRLTIRSP